MLIGQIHCRNGLSFLSADLKLSHAANSVYLQGLGHDDS